MSLDISLIDKVSGVEIAEMNWLRNQYGLIYWATDNVDVDVPKGKTLWYVINHWNYGKSNRVNRKLFKQVVDAYWEKIKDLEEGYFVFSLPSFVQFVAPHFDRLPQGRFGMIKGIKYNENHTKIMIPMEYFDHPSFHLSSRSDSMLQGWKDWFKKLVEFADLLQNKQYKYYCSN